MEEEIELNLDDKDKIREVTTTISNKTCQSIIRELSERELTESELSERLNLPLSTVHYNLMKLIRAGLVTSERFKYSNKGREVRYYKISKRRIIIRTFISRKVLTLLAYVTAGAGGIFFLLKKSKTEYAKASQSMIAESGKRPIAEAVNLGARSTTTQNHIPLWVILSILIALTLILSIWFTIRKSRGSK